MTTATAIPETPTTSAELVGSDPLPPPRAVLEGTIVPHVQTTTLPTNDEWMMLAHQANLLANSDTVPSHLRARPKAVMAVILKGRELGLAPIQAVSSIYFIEGTPTLSAHLMSALVKRAGHELWFAETSMERATICGQRRRVDGSLGPVETVTWTWDEVPEVLRQKANWKNYRPAMLRARATTALCRMSFADVLIGVWYAPEELGARIDASGSVVAMPAQNEALEAIGSLHEEESDPRMRPPQEPVRATDGSKIPPAAGLEPDVVEGSVAEPPAPLNREELWAEYLNMARIVGQSPAAFANRWASAHKRNITKATTQELADFVVERRGYVADYLGQHPEAANNEPTGKQPECPPDPEAPEMPAEASADERDHRETAPDGDARTYDPETGDKAEGANAEGVAAAAEPADAPASDPAPEPEAAPEGDPEPSEARPATEPGAPDAEPEGRPASEQPTLDAPTDG